MALNIIELSKSLQFLRRRPRTLKLVEDVEFRVLGFRV